MCRSNFASGYFKDGFSLQTGSGAALAVTRFLEEKCVVKISLQISHLAELLQVWWHYMRLVLLKIIRCTKL